MVRNKSFENMAELKLFLRRRTTYGNYFMGKAKLAAD
jgi:hypothetical protein